MIMPLVNKVTDDTRYSAGAERTGTVQLANDLGCPCRMRP